MRAMSFIQAWFFGIVAFAAMTLSLALAFSIAITGPPTDEEMEGLEGVMSRASQQVAVIARALGEEACTQLPPEATSGLCPAQTVATEQTPQPPIVIEETPEPPAVEPGAFSGEEGALAQNSVGEADLLGSAERADPAPPVRIERAAPAPARRAEARRPERRVAEAPRRARPAPARSAVAAARPPLTGAQVARVAPLPEAEDRDVVAMRARADLAIAAPEEEVVEETVYEPPPGPRQEQAAPAAYAPDEARAEDEWYEREQTAEEEAYDDYDAYEQRRERRRERRRARREQQRYYGGW